MRRVVVEIAIVCCIALAVGCDKAWQAYEAIEIGSPVPAENLLSREGRTEGHITAWDEDAVVTLPAIAATLSLRVVTDDAGNVIAKRYDAMAFGHWLLCQTIAIRQVLEVQVPEKAFHEPLADGLSSQESHRPPPPGKCTNVVQYLASINHQAQYGYHHNEAEDPSGLDEMTRYLLFGLYMWSYGKAPILPDLGEIAGVFDGVTKDGFDRRYTNEYGGTCRIQNLGDRRIRVESKYFKIFDPFMLLAGLEFWMVETEVNIESDGQ